jgi:hypothetical protein
MDRQPALREQPDEGSELGVDDAIADQGDE